jgi:CMP-N-acetylneuraminic acid synthetase
MSRSEALDATTDAVSRDRVVGLVPMRHDSERVRGKNYRPLDGRPLFHHVVDALLASGRVDEVVIDTDSPLITEDVAATYPDVTVLERPEALRGGHVPMNDVLIHDVQQVEADWYLQTHSTNPLLTPETIRRAVDAFLGARGEHDSLFSVTPLYTRLWTGEGAAVNHDPNVLLRTQDLPPIFEENSCIYIFSGANLIGRHNRIGERPLLFQMDATEAWDIDEELDWKIAEVLYAERARSMTT